MAKQPQAANSSFKILKQKALGVSHETRGSFQLETHRLRLQGVPVTSRGPKCSASHRKALRSRRQMALPVQSLCPVLRESSTFLVPDPGRLAFPTSVSSWWAGTPSSVPQPSSVAAQGRRSEHGRPLRGEGPRARTFASHDQQSRGRLPSLEGRHHVSSRQPPGGKSLHCGLEPESSSFLELPNWGQGHVLSGPPALSSRSPLRHGFSIPRAAGAPATSRNPQNQL